MPKIVPSTVTDRAIQLYVEKNLSIKQVSLQLCAEGMCVGVGWIRKSLKDRGVLRSHSQAMKLSNCREQFPRKCSGCNHMFLARRRNGRYCRNCAPDVLAWRRLATYGMSNSTYQMMLNKQHGACALCLESFDKLPVHKNKQTSIVIDHNHETGKTRGLLCNACNAALGHIETKSQEWLQRAQNYMVTEAV